MGTPWPKKKADTRNYSINLYFIDTIAKEEGNIQQKSGRDWK